MAIKNRIRVCLGAQLPDGTYKRINACYSGEPSSIVVFRLKGQCLAYRNLCVHMPRQLDGEEATIFDATGEYLRCSMHGIIYDPWTGESISTIYHGHRLTPVRVQENEGDIWITDKRVRPLDGSDETQ